MTEQPQAAPRRDIFADIAASDTASQPQPVSHRRVALVETLPPDLPGRVLPAEHDPAAAFTPRPPFDTPEQLAAELAAQRAYYAPYLRNLAPAPEATRITIPLAEFDWRVESAPPPADGSPANLPSPWARVEIPHYGAPLSRATCVYRTDFEVTAAMLARGSVFVCFKGVDYRAHVFVNGTYLGSHEGFFAAFEFDATRIVREGQNELRVQVENDAICMGNDSWGEDGDLYEGDKIYAATGPGYDDPAVGWHHCPPGMGIYQAVTVEARAALHIHDIFVRPILAEQRAEAWIEVYNCGLLRRSVGIELSLYGQNFEQTVFTGAAYELGGPAGPTVNYYRLPFEIPDARTWDLETPWLYQLQVRLLDEDGQTLDVQARQFGMRSFMMAEDAGDAGRLYLNGREIRLRGANTMGFEQQDVMRGNWDQLIDDVLLAKICHMNFWRLTQRPVQAEVYDYCDRLGLLTQTDLPLFGMLRRNQFSEAVRQAGEMERLVRSHACNIMVTYINEPFPMGRGKLHRHLSRTELERFFAAASHAVHQENPDRVIKPVDGDYDPPGPSLPDNHCYCGWYNGHGVDLGRLHRGYWQKVKPGWRYGCGEFGSEGLDPVSVMRGHYPPAWLPANAAEERTWMPDRIVGAQTGRFHYMWFDTQHSVADWVTASQAHQAWATRLMTDAFRRDSRMVSIAIHLFIDAFPSGWMKTIMDVERGPKPAYFVYRDALTPLMVNLRSDRTGFWAGERMTFEAWVCNDLDQAPDDAKLHYQLEVGGEVVFSQAAPADIPICSSACQGLIEITAPPVSSRTGAVVRLGLVSADGTVLHDTALEVTLFPPVAITARPVRVVGDNDSAAARLARELELPISPADAPDSRTIFISDPNDYAQRAESIEQAVQAGAHAIFLNLPPGEHTICGDRVEVKVAGMNARHFASRATGHPLIADLKPLDFRFWYDAEAGYATPLLGSTFGVSPGDGWSPILLSGNGDWSGQWGPAWAAAQRTCGAGRVTICQVALAGRTAGNPVARIFAARLLEA